MTRPHDYVVASVVTVQCPRCGQHQDIRIVGRSVGVVEFSGVCATPVPDAGFCSTTLRLSVAAHVFAAAAQVFPAASS
jgi:hypothetical protein